MAANLTVQVRTIAHATVRPCSISFPSHRSSFLTFDLPFSRSSSSDRRRTSSSFNSSSFPSRTDSLGLCLLQARGDLTIKVVGVAVQGEMLNLVNTINGMIDSLAIFASEVIFVARQVGTEGKLGAQAKVQDVEGTWQEIT